MIAGWTDPSWQSLSCFSWLCDENLEADGQLDQELGDWPQELCQDGSRQRWQVWRVYGKFCKGCKGSVLNFTGRLGLLSSPHGQYLNKDTKTGNQKAAIE